MKRLLSIIFIASFFKGYAQTIEYPVFDRTDESKFHIDKIVINSDTTYVHCTYHAEYDTWANISSQTYIESLTDGKKFPILKSEGLPFAPNKREVKSEENYHVVLKFSSIRGVNRLNLIEDPNDEAFNIYGIDLNNSFPCSYCESDVDSFYNRAMVCEEKKDWKEAIELLKKQLMASEFLYGKRSVECSWPMYSLTIQYFGTKEYEKVIEWGKKSIDILSVSTLDSINLDVLARAYGNVGTAYSLLKQPNAAAQYMELSLAARRQKDGVGVLNYEEYLMEMAKKYYYEENYPKALLYGKEVTSIYEKKFYENKHKYGCVYINTLNNLCEFYQRMDQFDDACKVGKQAAGLINEGVCENISWIKHAVYTNLAAALSTTGLVDEGIGYLEIILNETDSLHNGNDRVIANTKMLYANLLLDCKQDTLKAIKIFESILKTLEDSIAIGKCSYPEYSAILHKLYKVYIRKDKNIGLNYLRRTIQVQKEWQGKESVAYANLLLEYVNNTFVETINKEENTDTLFHYLYNASKIIKRHINNSIYNMSKADRDIYWNRYKYAFTWLIPMISNIIQTDEWSSMAYDASLFYKGMLLSSETEFKNVVLSSNDSILIEQFTDYVRDLSLLEAHYTGDNSLSDIDSLTSKIKRREYLLSQKVSRFNRQNKGTNYSWEEVKNHLREGDVAIEIVSFDINTTTYYDAYIIKNSSLSPRLISLFTDKGKLDNQLRTNSIDYKRLSMFIWGNKELKEELKFAKNIYFSASGLLNSIGIEYLPIENDQYIFDKYNLYRLSSTRELCYDNIIKRKENACLFGGLDYNSAKLSNKNENDTNYRLFRTVEDSIAKRGGFDPLDGSKEEIEQIKREFGKKINYTVFTDSEGTEESFKKLSGSNINIIHLSTHGMYIPDDENQMVKNNFRFVLSDEVPNIDEETQSLTHSFLVMSGGNMLIRRDSISEGKEDGILTALEISHLDFVNLDLVVLSACQTALGHMSSDGIYGLQRGFKKTGANTIIMSLDKVDDEATRILMVEFYKNLMAGKSKHQSLKDAQHYLRQVENGKYDDPKYWASFIMLDGLN